MMVLTLISQFIGLYKSSLLAKYFGTGIEIGSFNFVNNLSMFVFGMVGSAIATVVVPSLVRKEYKSISIFLNYIYLTSLLISIVLFVFKSGLVILLSGVNEKQFIDFSNSIFGMLLFSNLFLSLTNFIIIVCQVNKSFNYPKFVQLFCNFLLVASFYFFSSITVYQFAIVTSIVSVINLFMLFIDYKHCCFNYEFSFYYRDAGFRRMLLNVLPIFMATGAYQISLIIDTSLSSRLNIENITILSFATQITAMISTLFIGNLMSYLYPNIAKKVSENISIGDISKSIRKIIYYIFIFMSGIFVFYCFFGKLIINLLFVHGNFTDANGIKLYWILVVLIGAVPFSAIRDLIYRVFYAHDNTQDPFFNSLIATLINIVISIILAYYIGIIGIVLGTFIATLVSSIRSCFKLQIKYKIKLLW